MYNYKQLVAGFIIGMVVPALLIVLIHAVKFGENSFRHFAEAAIKEGVAAPIIALSLIGNLALFFLFLRFDRMWASRGVVLAMLLYGFAMVYIKFLL